MRRGCVHVTTSANGVQKASDSLKLELQVVVSHPTWVLETELRSPRTLSPVPQVIRIHSNVSINYYQTKRFPSATITQLKQSSKWHKMPLKKRQTSIPVLWHSGGSRRKIINSKLILDT